MIGGGGGGAQEGFSGGASADLFVRGNGGEDKVAPMRNAGDLKRVIVTNKYQDPFEDLAC